MVNKILTFVISVFVIFIISFGVWHFFLSIYEVKIVTDFGKSELEINSKYNIECDGLNSLGWEIPFRDLNCKFSVEKGSDLIEIYENTDGNKFTFLTLAKGDVEVFINSKFSLNPSYIKFNISEIKTVY